MLLTPPPVTNCHTFSDPLPLERDVLYGRPHMYFEGCFAACSLWLVTNLSDYQQRPHKPPLI